MITLYNETASGFEFKDYDKYGVFSENGKTEAIVDGKSTWFDDMGDGRLIDESGDTWFELSIDGMSLEALLNASEDFRKALAEYLTQDIEQPMTVNQFAALGGKTSSAKLTPEERSARAKKAVGARIEKYNQERTKAMNLIIIHDQNSDSPSGDVRNAKSIEQASDATWNKFVEIARTCAVDGDNLATINSGEFAELDDFVEKNFGLTEFTIERD
jgi:hypothetical protein